MRNRTSLGGSPMLLAMLGVLSPACSGKGDDAPHGRYSQPVESEADRGAEAGSSPTLQPSALQPFLNCVERDRNGGWVAHFGYQNGAAEPRIVPVGRWNSFHPGPQDLGQPTSFAPGRHDGIVRLELSSMSFIDWRLGDGHAIASRLSPVCMSSVFCGDRHVDCKVDLNGVLHCEQCDDGNVEGGDGCSARCVTEPGWICARPGEPCVRPSCGDGRYDWQREQCDDGNVTSDDGCSSFCRVEHGWVCPGEGQACYRPRCGDGRVDSYIDSIGDYRREDCDDGNVEPGDGCTPDCTVMPGWVCENGQNCYVPTCGDGHVDCHADEAGNWLCDCDDGNVHSGDGCSAACEVEAGWVCGTAGSPCRRARCGDGRIDVYTDADGGAKSEECDDGNRRGKDGCSQTCTLEPGWVCPEPGWPCRRPVCGNGLVEAYTNTAGEWLSEGCDDGNRRSGDSCSSTCTIEPGWTCSGWDLPCHRVTCGDGILDWYSDESGNWSPEGDCDDGNTLDGDGCSASCAIEPGWICNTPGLPCDRRCGNGQIESIASEQCDDGNTVSGDGCSASCAIEPGWICKTPGRLCDGKCGNGRLEPIASERCDDGNSASGDGCSAACTIEPGWVCGTAGQPCRWMACGDGFRDCYTAPDGAWVCEQCDDGNLQAGDGCSVTCTVEPGWACDAAGRPCHWVTCGDGFQDSYVGPDGAPEYEECDDGNLQAGDGCSPSCTAEPGWHCGAGRCVRCGDGHIDYGVDYSEQCDDGNAQDGDGCSSLCRFEPNWICGWGEPCRGPCGDGIINCRSFGDRSECEACDDGNLTNGDGCSAACEVETETATGLCTEEHWCWLNPQPQGIPLAAGWASPDGTVWAVGDQVVLRTSGPRWSYVNPRVTRKLTAISGTSNTDVWAVGEGILHWNGTTWADMSYAPNGATVALNSVWAVGSNNAWAVGPTGLVLHWNGSAWTPFETPIAPGVTPPPDLRKIWASSSNALWVLGSDQTLHHWDGAAWSVPSPGGETADFWASAPNDVRVAYRDGTVARWDGVQWAKPGVGSDMPVSLNAQFSGLYVAALGGTIHSAWLWAVGWDHSSRGFMAGIPGVSMTYAAYEPNISVRGGSIAAWPLTSVVPASPNNVWAFGRGATMAHFDGTNISTWSNDLFLQGMTDTSTPVYLDPFLLAAWSDSPNNVWVVGGYHASDLGLNIYCGRSLAAHWDGRVWSAAEVPSLASVTDVVATGPNDVWVVGSLENCSLGPSPGRPPRDSGLFHWSGSDWVKAGDQTQLAAEWASTPSDLWAAGSGYVPPRDGIPEITLSGNVLHWTGAEWATVDTGLASSISISGTGPDDIWVVGVDQAGPKLVHWDGTAWAAVPQQAASDAGIPAGGLPYSSALKKVVAVSRDAVWIGTDAGVFFWNGSTWQNAPMPFVPYSLAGGPGAGVIAISSTNGVIRHD